VTVTGSFDGSTKEVNLSTLETTYFGESPAVRITRVLETAALEIP